MTSYLTSMDTSHLSRTVFEIFDFKVFRVWPRPLTYKGHLGSKYVMPFESPCTSSYYITLHHITSTLHHITSLTSHHITSHPIPSHHITSHHITSHHITSHHITSHYITLRYITLHYITLHYNKPTRMNYSQVR